MKKTKLVSVTAASVLALSMFAGCCFLPEKDSDKINLDGMKLVWEENFAAGSLDESAWNQVVWNAGYVNNEVQSYVKNTNIDLNDNGADEGSNDGSTLRQIAKSTNGTTWTSSRIDTATKVSFKYGYVEARIKMPVAYDASDNVLTDEDGNVVNNGVWPAFWMMPEDKVDEETGKSLGKGGQYGIWPRSGEIDIMEYSPSTSGQKAYATLHHATSKTDATDQYPSLGGVVHQSVEDAQSWHTYGILWTEGMMEAYYDGVSLGAVYGNPGGGNWAKYPYDQDFYIILNLAMGGNLGGSINSDMRKAVYEIDYVKVYQDKDNINIHGSALDEE